MGVTEQQQRINARHAQDIERARELGNKDDPDHFGRFPWDVGEFGHKDMRRSLTLSKKALGEFCEACLRMQIQINSFFTLAPQYKGSAVVARVHASLAQKEKFEAETGWALTPPPMAHIYP